MPDSPDRRLRTRGKLAACGKWYDERLDVHERLARKLQTLLEELLSAKRIQFHRVESRVKARSGLLQKAKKRKYSRPVEQITDVVGVRVITYLDATVRDVCSMLEAEFEIDVANSPDKGDALGIDRVGYRSRHYVAKLNGPRSNLAECAEFRAIAFEVQVRSLLQHAWAEMEHDRRFKYQGELPDDIKRRFSLLAGQLEAADREFNAVAREIDAHAARTVREAVASEADEQLTVVDAVAYLRGLFAPLIASGAVEPGLGGAGGGELFDELERYGVRTLRGLAELVPNDFVTRFPEVLAEQTTFIGILRDAMMLRDADRYFRDAYRGQWHMISPIAVEMLKMYGVDIEPLLTRFGIFRGDSDDEQEDDLEECSFCGELVSPGSLQAIGAGGQEAPLACRSCVETMHE